MHLRSLRLLGFLLLSLSPLATPALRAQLPAGDVPDLEGRVEANRYYSPTGLFDIEIPLIPMIDGRISDTANVVTFEDGYLTHVTIALYPLDATQRWELSTRGKKDYLVYFFANAVLPGLRQTLPGSSVESAKYLPEVHEGALLLQTLMPGGTRFQGRRNFLGAEGKPAIAKRGNLLFIHGDSLLIISSELGEAATEGIYHKMTLEQESGALKERLIKIHNSIRFTTLAIGAAPTPGAAK